MICHACHSGLGGGALSLGATGEFKVPSDMLVEAAGAQAGEQPTATNICAWCGKLEAQVKKLLGRNDVALCNECISLACDILDAEVGAWR